MDQDKVKDQHQQICDSQSSRLDKDELAAAEYLARQQAPKEEQRDAGQRIASELSRTHTQGHDFGKLNRTSNDAFEEVVKKRVIARMMAKFQLQHVTSPTSDEMIRTASSETLMGDQDTCRGRFRQCVMRILTPTFDKKVTTEVPRMSSAQVEEAMDLVSDQKEFEEFAMKAYGLTSAELKEYETAFKLLDQDGGGLIQTAEMHQALMGLGLDLDIKDVEHMMQVAITEDGSGCKNGVDFKDFVAVLNHNPRSEDTVDDLKELFVKMKKFGLHTVENLRLEFGSGPEVDALVEFLDKDGDGELNEAEFVAAMRAA